MQCVLFAQLFAGLSKQQPAAHVHTVQPHRALHKVGLASLAELALQSHLPVRLGQYRLCAAGSGANAVLWRLVLPFPLHHQLRLACLANFSIGSQVTASGLGTAGWSVSWAYTVCC